MDGTGGALRIADVAVNVELSASVEFVENEARGGNGGAIAIEAGARLSASGTLFLKNEGSQGGAVSLKVIPSPVQCVESNRDYSGF